MSDREIGIPSLAGHGVGWALQHEGERNDVDAARIRLAEATRRIIDEQATTIASADAIERARALVAEAAALLAGREHGRPYDTPAEGSLQPPLTGGLRPFADFSPLVGAMSPIAPPLAVEREGDEVVARATFGLAFEGPPGCLHGGFIAAAFDEVLGLAQTISGQAGMTGRLTVHYRSPTPLHQELVFRGRLVQVDGRKVLTEATLHADGRLCAEAEGLFVSLSPAAFERLAEARGVRRT